MEKIKICEVGPRDGFQNICSYIPVEIKLDIIDKIVESGIKDVQITSFVSPKAIPQMKDAQELSAACVNKYREAVFSALVPNLRGAQIAWETGIKKVSYVVSLSESHNKANIRRTHEESFDELQKILKDFPELDVCIDLSTTFGCPFEGRKKPEEVVSFLEPYVGCGIHTVNLCDTIGVANPAQVRRTIDAVKRTYSGLELVIHIHDTRNMGMVNTLAAIESGVHIVQSTLGGLGGCPYAPGASGNLATEDLIFMLSEMGYETGADVKKIVDAAKYETDTIPDGVYSGHLYKIADDKFLLTDE